MSNTRTPLRTRIKEVGRDPDGGHLIKASMRIEAMSLNIPEVVDHPNRMPFSGILTRVGLSSDKAPHGTDGKRVLLTQSAAESAIASLLGMGVDLTADLGGHDAQKKVGVITAAHIDGDALNIEGFIYAADFPREALRIHLNAADLGFSFEAQNLVVESLDTDPLVVKSLVFTGAAILMKDAAAYQTTALAAAAEKEIEMNEELMKAIAAAVSTAMAPIATEVAGLKEGLSKVDQIAASVEDIKKNPPMAVNANAVTMERVEPHAKSLDACAASMEAAGIGTHATRGHATVMRQMAGHMRAQAAMGQIPSEYSGGASYYASADDQAKTIQSATEKAVKDAMASVSASAPKIEESTEFKALKDKLAATETKLKDVQAATAANQPPPDRKTLPPHIASVMSKAGITAPEGDEKLNVATVDAALASAGITDTHQRLQFKTGLRRQGMLTS